MEEKSTDIFATLLTSLGMTQYQNKILFWTSLISTILGIIITLLRNIIIPLVKKIKDKKVTVDDIVDAGEKVKDIIEDVSDDGKLNNSNK